MPYGCMLIRKQLVQAAVSQHVYKLRLCLAYIMQVLFSIYTKHCLHGCHLLADTSLGNCKPLEQSP